jgi:hypothetical protein
MKRTVFLRITYLVLQYYYVHEQSVTYSLRKDTKIVLIIIVLSNLVISFILVKDINVF